MSEPSLPEPVALPIARVAVDVSLAHLDRPFDYRVTPAMDTEAVPGSRVRVRFAGKLRDGFVLERLARTEHSGQLASLHKVVSAEPVLTPEIARLIRRVADHYASCFADVMRLAVPPRHAATERAARPTGPPPELTCPEPGPLAGYLTGPQFLSALADGHGPRAAWQLIPSTDPTGDWADGLARCAAATASGGRGSVLVVPGQRDLDRLSVALAEHVGRIGFVALSADAGPSARYRAFLAALRGEVSIVAGTRAAAFAPVRRLGLVAVYDDGDDLLAEQRAPYPHARTVLALRAADAGCAFLAAGYARSAEIQQLSERGWLRELAAERTTLRHTAPRVKVSLDSDHALERDPLARAARLPHEVFELVRSALPQGPVLVQVPRGGYLVGLVCQDCREPVRCPHCGGPARADRDTLSCRWCGRELADWVCPICGSTRVRAPVVGADRTADELGRAFPGTTIRQSSGDRVLSEAPDTPALVVATPGAEPDVPGGYAAAVLLDTGLLLFRADLRAAEEALRRWLAAVALVRPGPDGGTVLAVGESSARALQALVRLDPVGFAARELAERREAGYPPAVKLVVVEGRLSALTEVLDLIRPPADTQTLGPIDLGTPQPADEPPVQRLTFRAPLPVGSALVRAVKDVTAIRSARKSEGGLRVRVDPAEIT